MTRMHSEPIDLTPDRESPANADSRLGPFARWLVKAFFARLPQLSTGTLLLRLPGGTEQQVTGTETGPQAQIAVHSLRAVRRLLTGGSVGFAEAYIDGDWDSPDLVAVIELAARNARQMEGALRGPILARLANRLIHIARANTKRGSRRNIAAHYDLGNAFYEAWLDPGMTYSAAIFAAHDEPLEAAQTRKYRALCDRLELQPGDHLLEIGCGWGALAEFAAKTYGCRVTAVTLSREQARYARGRIRRAGLADRVTIRLQDYRDLEGRFDAVASVEMFEAIGEAQWPTYFAAMRRLLAPGGRAAMQVITIDEARFAAYRKSADFIQRYIFPGGMLPSPGAVRKAGEDAGLAVQDEHFFGADYARTLARWSEAFETAWPDIRELGFDERFRRMWRYYLAYCEGGFRAGTIDVMQLTLRPR